MTRKLIALFAGPLLLMVLPLAVSDYTPVVLGILFFEGIFALIFIAYFAVISELVGKKSLWKLLLVANALPTGFWVFNCFGKLCPNASLEAVAPWYIGASFCAFVYWLIAGRS